MQQLICPLDGKPCEADCPDRYKDQPEGGDIGTLYVPSSLTGKEGIKL